MSSPEPGRRRGGGAGRPGALTSGPRVCVHLGGTFHSASRQGPWHPCRRHGLTWGPLLLRSCPPPMLALSPPKSGSREDRCSSGECPGPGGMSVGRAGGLPWGDVCVGEPVTGCGWGPWGPGAPLGGRLQHGVLFTGVFQTRKGGTAGGGARGGGRSTREGCRWGSALFCIVPSPGAREQAAHTTRRTPRPRGTRVAETQGPKQPGHGAPSVTGTPRTPPCWFCFISESTTNIPVSNCLL